MGCENISPYRIKQLLALSLVLLTLAAFWRVPDCRFVNYDDPVYVTHNPHVHEGLTRASAAWAFTTTYNTNWHPLTWLSLQLDNQLFGPKGEENPTGKAAADRWYAYGSHLTNLLLHTANVVLLFCVLARMTGQVWPSALVAALFAVHPLHVESVAWIAERKDVLSTLFWMLTLGGYVRYAEKPSVASYLVVVIALALGLMAKPMLVTLPFVLLLLDYWPLHRFEFGSAAPATDARRAAARRLVVEKLPLFALSIASCVMTVYAQGRGGAVRRLDDIPFTERTANAVLAYGDYIIKMFWPRNLAVLYPFREVSWSDGRVLATALALTVVTALVLWQIKLRPYLFTGWFWYLGTLVPVIGLVQVGDQALADRYTYVPLIGLFLMIAWSMAEVAARRPALAPVSAALAGVAVIACGLGTWQQTASWHDSIVLWQHTLAVTGPNAEAYYGLATAYSLELDQPERAAEAYAQAVQVQPRDERARLFYGITLIKLGKWPEAGEQFAAILELNPTSADAHFHLGLVASHQDKVDEAVAHFTAAVSLRPNHALGHLRLAVELAKQHKTAAARSHLSEALRLYPDFQGTQIFEQATRDVHAAELP
jgi:protein O-mannosyl-transferase